MATARRYSSSSRPQAARLLAEESRQALEPVLLGRELGFEEVEASLSLLDGRLCSPQLGHDRTELGREDALLLLRSRDLRLELGDALVDLCLLRPWILARGRCREDQRERKAEDDRKSSHAHEVRSPAGRPFPSAASLAPSAPRSSSCSAPAASRRSGPTSAR